MFGFHSHDINKSMASGDVIKVDAVNQDGTSFSDLEQTVYAVLANDTFLTTEGNIFEEKNITSLILFGPPETGIDLTLSPKAKAILDSMTTGVLQTFDREPE